MAGEKQELPWPVPAFQFKVEIDGVGEIACAEVSGLEAEADVIEYRAGNSKEYSVVKMPGLMKYTDITLKKGMFQDDKVFNEYFAKITMNTIERKTVTIQLLDEAANPVFTWTLTNAFPKKVSGPSFNAKTSEAAMEELVLAHEGIKMEI
ncbi:MAG: phage tail protein [Bacteroidota bacterium]|jgi:phage tail-like protein